MQPQPEAREISSAYQAEQPTASVAWKLPLEEYLIYVAKERSMKIWSAQEEVSCSYQHYGSCWLWFLRAAGCPRPRCCNFHDSLRPWPACAAQSLTWRSSPFRAVRGHRCSSSPPSRPSCKRKEKKRGEGARRFRCGGGAASAFTPLPVHHREPGPLLGAWRLHSLQKLADGDGSSLGPMSFWTTTCAWLTLSDVIPKGLSRTPRESRRWSRAGAGSLFRRHGLDPAPTGPVCRGTLAPMPCCHPSPARGLPRCVGKPGTTWPETWRPARRVASMKESWRFRRMGFLHRCSSRRCRRRCKVTNTSSRCQSPSSTSQARLCQVELTSLHSIEATRRGLKHICPPPAMRQRQLYNSIKPKALEAQLGLASPAIGQVWGQQGQQKVSCPHLFQRKVAHSKSPAVQQLPLEVQANAKSLHAVSAQKQPQGRDVEH